MPTYVFRCSTCGDFERRAPMTSVPDTAPCPACAAAAARSVTAPALHTPGTAHRVAAAHERSAHAPDVVRTVPVGARPGPAARPATAADPRHSRLPRP